MVTGRALTDLTPREWIEYQRELAGYIESPPAMNATSAKINDWLYGPDSKVPNRFAHLTPGQADDNVMAIYMEMIELSQVERIKLGQPHFSLFPTFEFRARVDTTPRGDKIVLLHSGLVQTVMFWSMLASFQFCQNDKYNEFMRDYWRVAEFFTKVGQVWKLELTRVGPEGGDALMLPLTEEAWRFSRILTYSCMTFILGHEIGHIIERHSGYTDDRATNHAMEYAADRWGMRICSRHIITDAKDLQHDATRIRMIGPYLALSVIMAHGNRDTLKHPSVTARAMRLSKEFKNIFKSELDTARWNSFKNTFGAGIFTKTRPIGEEMVAQHEAYRGIIEMIAKGARRAIESGR